MTMDDEDQGADEEVPIRIKTEEIMLDDVELPFEEIEDQKGILTINSSIPVVSPIINDHQSTKELMENLVKSELETVENEIRDVKKEFDAAEGKNLKCQHCSYSTSFKSNLKPHIEAVHLKMIRFKCKDCHFKCYYKHLMDKHSNINHSGISSGVRNEKCPHCNITFCLKGNLKTHIEAVHQKIKRFQCQYCDYNCYEKRTLKDHINGRHLDLKEFKCDFCDYETARNHCLKMHISGVHEKDEGLKCKYCNYCTNKKEELMNHFQLGCDNDQSMEINSTITNSSLNSLPLTSSRNKDTEESVGENFYNLTNLRKIKCEHCRYSTCRKSILKRHIERVHLKIKNHKGSFTNGFKRNLHKKPLKHSCQYCDYKTNRKNKLKEHINGKHLGIKNFKCNFCDFKTAIKWNVNQHVNRIHIKKEDLQISHD